MRTLSELTQDRSCFCGLAIRVVQTFAASIWAAGAGTKWLLEMTLFLEDIVFFFCYSSTKQYWRVLSPFLLNNFALLLLKKMSLKLENFVVKIWLIWRGCRSFDSRGEFTCFWRSSTDKYPNGYVSYFISIAAGMFLWTFLTMINPWHSLITKLRNLALLYHLTKQ